MNKLNQFMLKAHRLLGQIISVYVLLWFLSAFVMLFQPYPSYSPEEAEEHRLALPEGVSISDGELERMVQAVERAGLGEEPYRLHLEYAPLYGVHYHLEGRHGAEGRWSTMGEPLSAQAPDTDECRRVAALWGAQLLGVDTLESLDQWTPFERLRRDLPFYRLRLDKEGREVYLSSYDGRIITEHTRSERLWAWVGSIPHWVYFSWLRQHATLWRWVVALLALVGTLMAVAGLWIGVQRYWITRRSRRGLHSPYRRPAERWHHILGTLSGIFILLWLFSGMMSVIEIPEWLGGKSDPSGRLRLEGRYLGSAHYDTAALNGLLEQSGGAVQRVSLSSLGEGIALVELRYRGELRPRVYRLDEVYRPLELTQDDAAQAVQTAYRLGAKPEVDLLDETDGYYYIRPLSPSAPVYRIVLPTPQEHYVYIEPELGQVKVLEWRERLRMLVYTKPHALKFSFLEYHSTSWWAVMVLLLVVGTAVSLTGVWLIVRRLRRRH